MSINSGERHAVYSIGELNCTVQSYTHPILSSTRVVTCVVKGGVPVCNKNMLVLTFIITQPKLS